MGFGWRISNLFERGVGRNLMVVGMGPPGGVESEYMCQPG